MAVAQGSCPNCGAPVEFGLAASIAKVCEYCRATVVRSDRGLENLGIAAELTDLPSLIAVGDEGTLGGRPFKVFGRVQLDHGKGPWDEYYVAFDYGAAWGWLAYAQGQWYVTALAAAPERFPAYDALRLEEDVPLGAFGVFRVAEIKTGEVKAIEGEVPAGIRAGVLRHYADCYGQGLAFATLDYGDNTTGGSVFTGFAFAEAEMRVTELGPRSVKKVKTTEIKCPSCGGDVPKLTGERALRLGCPYCGAVTDIGTREIVAHQETALRTTEIPIGGQARFEGGSYVCTAYVRRASFFEGERYSWEEYLLFSQGIGFRWLVKDPESGWIWVDPVNLAEIDLGGLPERVSWRGRTFRLRNQNQARVEYVLGEVYWQCEVGETVEVMDFAVGSDVLSREASPGEARWSYATPIAWPLIARAFGLPVDGPGGRFAGGSSGGQAPSVTLVLVIVVAVLLIFCALSVCGDAGTGGGFRGGGIYFGGK